MSDLSKEEQKLQRNRTVRLLTYFSIAAIVMMFGGLISAVYVSYKDKFWVNLELPSSFLTSTLVIILSSLVLFLALKFAKNNKKKPALYAVISTLLLGIAFVFFQIRGYQQMIEKGNRVKGSIFYQHGAYGDKFIVSKNNQPIYFDGKQYKIDGKPLESKEVSEVKQFLQPICANDKAYKNNTFELINYGYPYGIMLVTDQNQYKPLALVDKKLHIGENKMVDTEMRALFYFAFGVVNDMPYFMMKGEYGKDFTISLNGETLLFENRRLYFPPFELSKSEIESIDAQFFDNNTDYSIKKGRVTSNGKDVDLSNTVLRFSLPKNIAVKIENGKWIQMQQELTPGQYNEFYQAGNNASSYLYVITALHALHILLAIGMLVVLTYRTSKGYYTSNNTNGMEAASIFWHFLGILWIFLYLFWISITI